MYSIESTKVELNYKINLPKSELNMNNNQCICCNTGLEVYNNKGFYCPNCFSVFVKEIPSKTELTEHYNKYNEKYHGGGRKEGAEKRQMAYAEKYFTFIKKFGKGKSLIDIGSANNPLPNIAFSGGYKVTVADFQRSESLHQDIPFLQTSIEEIDTSNLKYDIVTSFAVLEHTRLPIQALDNLVNLAKPKGQIIIYIPEIGGFFDNYSLGTSTWFCPPEHLNLFSKKGLTLLMERKSCTLIHYSRFELNPLRFLVRYGIGFVEGLIGYCVKIVNKRFWLSVRQKRKSKYRGMGMFVFNKNG